jgi:hypothetical protein
LTVHLEHTQADLDNRVQAHERDLEELQLQQEKVKELQLEAGPAIHRNISEEESLDRDANTSLGDELATDIPTETKTT